MIKLVIFDLDGTLLNSLEDLADSCNYLLRKYGFLEHPLDSYRYFVGDGIHKLVERILPEDKRQPDFVEQVFQEMVAYYDIHKEDKTVPYPGIVETYHDFYDPKEEDVYITDNRLGYMELTLNNSRIAVLADLHIGDKVEIRY